MKWISGGGGGTQIEDTSPEPRSEVVSDADGSGTLDASSASLARRWASTALVREWRGMVAIAIGSIFINLTVVRFVQVLSFLWFYQYITM